MKYIIRSGDGYFMKFIFGNTPMLSTDASKAKSMSRQEAEAVKEIMNKAGYVANIERK